ncbi:kinase-like domain-containing protein, partial [Epithele typhae]|uniref:kinase-like domain-containing protein n=1 Tax=Epithele typhae TaxID=378194 RepID=UPI0020088109
MVQMSSSLPNFTGIILTQDDFYLRLVEELGSGAYGVVYLAEDISPTPRGPRYYAVKCMLRYPERSELAGQQRRELALHAALADIPHVVGLHAIIEEELHVYLVLDFCPGSDLFSAIMDRAAYAQNDEAIRRVFLQIIDALAECHARGVYHRDLKPENILVSADDRDVFLADFGLATRSTRSTNFGCGSSFYMSPECLGTPTAPSGKGKPYRTGPSDVWSLGTILCNLVSGRNPWHIASATVDNGFRTYLREGPAWLHANLPISAGTAAILGAIFEPSPRRRITLPVLREAVLQLDSFFPVARP